MTPGTEGIVLSAFVVATLLVVAILYLVATYVAREVRDALSKAIFIGGICTAIVALYAPVVGERWHQMATDSNTLFVGLTALALLAVGIVMILHPSHDLIMQGICLAAVGVTTFLTRVATDHDLSVNWFVGATLVTTFLLSFFSSLSLSLFRK